MAESVADENHAQSVAAPQNLPDDVILIAGGGPVGLVLAHTLSFYGIKSIVFEQNETTTRWPKMDLTNSRTMEIFKQCSSPSNTVILD